MSCLYNRIIFHCLLAGLSLQALSDVNEVYRLASPDGEAEVFISCHGDELSYSVSWRGVEIVAETQVDLFSRSVEYDVKGNIEREQDVLWEPTWGQFSSVRDRHRELKLQLVADGMRIDLILRLFDDGMGVRFAVPAQPNPDDRTLRFSSMFKFAENLMMYSYPVSETTPIRPINLGQSRPQRVHLPALLKHGDKLYTALLESDLYSAHPFEAADLRMLPGGARLRMTSEAVLGVDGVLTPWRVVLWGESPGDLLTSKVALNLAAPNKIDDTDWIATGTGVWDWRVQ